MLLCAYLVYKGKNFPETQNDPLQSVDKPLPYLFYRGIELHPRIFDIDVKQVLKSISNTRRPKDMAPLHLFLIFENQNGSEM